MAVNGFQNQTQFGGPYGNSSAYQDIFNQILGNVGPNYTWDNSRTQSKLDQYGTDFTQQFQNAVGRAPSPDEINQFYSQAVSPIMGTQAGFGATDPNAVVSQYVPQAFQSQIQEHGKQALPDLGKQISDLSTQIAGQTADQLGNPNSHLYQAMSGGMNNLGISPSSGAFQAGLGSTIGGSASTAIQSLLGSLGGGAIAGNQSPSFQSLYGTGQNAGAGMAGYNQNLNDFNLQADLGKYLAGQSEPSGLQKGLGYANLASNTLSNVAGPGMAMASQTSYICLAMIERGLLHQWQLDELHYHIMPALFRKGRAFWNYAKHGRALVQAANAAGIDWKEYVHLFYDRVMAEPDSIKAVDLYAEATKELCLRVAPHLWDERVLRCSLTDSLPFVPLLFTYRPFLQTMRKVLGMRMLFLYDNPLSRI